MREAGLLGNLTVGVARGVDAAGLRGPPPRHPWLEGATLEELDLAAVQAELRSAQDSRGKDARSSELYSVRLVRPPREAHARLLKLYKATKLHAPPHGEQIGRAHV